MKIKPTQKRIKIKLEEEKAYKIKKTLFKTKKEVIKDRSGQPQYWRHDYTSLMVLLDYFQTSLHTMEEMKIWVKLKDKIRINYFNKQKELELTQDEAEFLKDFLKNFQEKDGKNINLREFETRTLIGVLEQLN